MIAEEKEHAEAGPSSSKTWMLCPASVTLSRGKPRRSSTYAREGSAAHLVAELLIKDEPVPPTITIEGETFDVTDEMVDYVSGYVAYAQSLESMADFFAVEQRVTLEAYYPTGMPEPVFGTSDLVAYMASTRTLDVADLKYGKGHKVSAKDNSQGRIYALGAIAELVAAGFPEPREIKISIFQPRIRAEPDVEVLSHAQLMTWMVQELVPAIERLGNGDTTEAPGDCFFCARKFECASFRQDVYDVAFPDDANEPNLPADFSNAELGAILTKAAMIESWIEGVQKEAEARIEAGQTVPGWKLEPTRPTREWEDEEEVRAVMKKAGLFLAEMIENKLKSPAQMEKVLKSKGKKKEGVDLLMKGLVVKRSKGVKLVEDSTTFPDNSSADALRIAAPGDIDVADYF